MTEAWTLVPAPWALLVAPSGAFHPLLPPTLLVFLQKRSTCHSHRHFCSFVFP